jgi:signal peptidase I
MIALKVFFSGIKDWIITLLITILLIFVIRTFIFSPVVVEGESMLPTLHDGDRLFINKLGMYVGELERFDVIVFKTKKDKYYIKRIIGMPGDELKYENQLLYINGKPIDEPYIIPYHLQKDFTIQSLYGYEVIPEDHYFVLGDNRENSNDSRKRFIGLIHEKQILGSANQVVWPISSIKNIKE